MTSYINSYIGNYQNYIPQFLSSSKPTPSAELENAIYSADISSIKTLINSSPDLLSTPFANGDLPLNVAVREKKFECIQALLLLGADPKQRDNQQLSAVDYAIMTKDDQLVAEILKHFVSADMASVKTLLQNDQNLKQVKATALEITTTFGKTVLTVLPTLHQAIFLKNKEWLKDLLAQTTNIANIRTVEGNSILHFAAASGDAEILNLCLSHPSSADAINAQNAKGQTPLHYAAALDHLDSMQQLVEKGANIKSEDSSKITPLALLSAHANDKNPLNVSRREMFIFLTSTAFCASQFLPLHTLSLESYVLLQGALFGGRIIGDVMLFGANFKTWKGLFGNIALSALMSTDSTLKFAFTAFNTALFSKNLFAGLNSCWRNASLDPAKAMTKAVVGYAPKAKYIYDFVQTNVFPLEIKAGEKLTPLEDFAAKKVILCQNTNHQALCMQKAWKGVQVCTDDPQSEACMDAGDELGNFLERDHFFKTSDKLNVSFGNIIDYYNECGNNFESPACLRAEAKLKAEAGLNNTPGSEQSCFDAKVIIGCVDQGLQECKKIFRKAVLSVHPDKTNNDPEKTKIYKKLSDAMKTIENCSK